MSDLFLGRVVAVHQHDNSLDIQLVYDGSVLTGVPLMCPMMTTSSGVSNMHHPEGNDWNAPGSTTRDIYVIVSKTDGGYIALGYISPQVNQMMFDRVNFKIDRHASDVYSSITNEGDVELSHPSGSFVKFGENMGHEDLAGLDCDKLWSITRNLDTAPGMFLKIKNNGITHAQLRFTSDGNVDLIHEKNLSIRTGLFASLVADRDITITSKTAISINAMGDITISAGGDVVVNAANIALFSGTLTHNGVNVGCTHVHGGVVKGPDDSGVPH